MVYRTQAREAYLSGVNKGEKQSPLGLNSFHECVRTCVCVCVCVCVQEMCSFGLVAEHAETNPYVLSTCPTVHKFEDKHGCKKSHTHTHSRIHTYTHASKPNAYTNTHAFVFTYACTRLCVCVCVCVCVLGIDAPSQRRIDVLGQHVRAVPRRHGRRDGTAPGQDLGPTIPGGCEGAWGPCGLAVPVRGESLPVSSLRVSRRRWGASL